MIYYAWFEGPPGSRRWVCDCGACGVRFMDDRFDLLRTHLNTTHGARAGIIHGPAACAPKPCPFHNPSPGPMRDWPKYIRHDRGLLVERICPHGVGHPDPDSLRWVNEQRAARGWDPDNGTHGCDGCGHSKEVE